MSDVIATFGNWQVTKEGMNSLEPYEYNLSTYDLFESRVEDGIEVWEFPIHLTEKTWMHGEHAHRMNEFNEAFAFAQKHFASLRPPSKANVSDAHTRKVQEQMIRFTS